MAQRRMITLSSDGRLALRAPDGREEQLPPRRDGWVCLLVDSSGSMAGPGIGEARAGARDFVTRALNRNYYVSLIGFSDGARFLVSSSRDNGLLMEAVDGLHAGGGTNMTAALQLARRELAERSGNRYVVLASDGAPNDRDTARVAARELAQMGVRIITVATSDADLAFLASIATDNDLAIVVPEGQIGSGMARAALSLPPGGQPS